MWKQVLASGLLMLGLSFSVQPVLAANLVDGLEDAGGPTGAGYDTNEDITVLIGLLIRVVLGLMGVIFLILVIYAGITWMTAAGDAKKVDKAKGILTTSVIGLIIVLTAYSITTFVLSQLTFATTTS